MTPSNTQPNSMANDESKKMPTWQCCLTFLLIIVLMGGTFFLLVSYYPYPKPPTFSIESTAVKSYNLTSDNRLYTLIDLGLRAGNPNTDYSGYYMVLNGMNAKVSKGKHHALAEWELPDPFPLDTGSDALMRVETAGQRTLESRIAEELRADAAAREGRVNVRLDLSIGVTGLRCDCDSPLRVTCKDVVVDFSRPTERVQSVDCKARWSQLQACV